MFRNQVYSRSSTVWMWMVVILGGLAGGCWSHRTIPRVDAQVPAYHGYPVSGGCLYISAQGAIVFRELPVGVWSRPTQEECR